MADTNQFGSAHFGDARAAQSLDCGRCETMLTDAVDGTLSAEDQAIFDAHLTHCDACSKLLAEAKRGAAWLEMLRTPRPEPPAALLERILVQTSGAQAPGGQPFASQHFASQHFANQPFAKLPASPLGVGRLDLPATPSSVAPVPMMDERGRSTGARVLPFRMRAAGILRTNPFAQVMMQPRLAMTAAMAFFSIALTLNLTGVRIQDLHARDLGPSSLKRDFYSADARVTQYYEGLRVVYELESRVHDLKSASDTDSPASSTPSSDTPADQALPTNETPASQQPKRPSSRPNPAPGTSLRSNNHLEGGLA